MKRSMAVMAAFLVTASAAAFAAEQKIAGEIVKVDGSSIQLKTSGGELLDVRLADNVRFSGRAPSDWSKVTQGAFVGTAAVPQADGTLLAREVHVFPESMRGTGEGHRPMDNEPGSTMTNATVSRVGKTSAQKSTMTNATVTQVSGGQGTRSLTLRYQGGEKTVIVPDNVPVVMVEPVDRSNLVPGARVVVYAAPQGDGKLTAQRVTIGVRGAVPPA
jgi:nitrogen regulatory protein PII